MKYREPVGIAQDAAGIRFFASCLDETLYEYTPAKYKPRVMGVRSLVVEAKSIIDRIEAGAMDRSRLYPILEEIKICLQENSIAKALLSFPVDFYCLCSKEEDLKSVRTRLGLLGNSLRGGRYRSAIQHEIIKLCADGKRKEELRFASRLWVSAARNFSSQYIHEVVVKEFFNGEVKYFVPSDVDRFFQIFSAELEKFEVAFLVGDVVAELDDIIKKFHCQVLGVNEEYDCGLTPSISERIVLVKNVSGRDHFLARNKAEARIEHIADLFSVFHHKNRIKWKPEVAVRREGSDFRVLPARSSSVARSRDNVPKKASQKLSLQLGGLSFSDMDSVGRFVSVIRLHGAAQEAASAQAQLVNLWTAMEVLVSRETESKLRGVKRCIIPFLVHSYFDRILHGLTGDLYRWKRRPTSRLLKSIDLPDWPQHHKLAAILLGSSLEGKRNELYAMLEGFPLLGNRCFQVSKLISNSSEMIGAIKSHEQSISWQIERIYRGRNAIVHDGSAPARVDILTENAHDYLDAFIDRFFVLCSQMNAVANLDEAIAYQSRLYEEWRSRLNSSRKISVDMENVRHLCALDFKGRKAHIPS